MDTLTAICTWLIAHDAAHDEPETGDIRATAHPTPPGRDDGPFIRLTDGVGSTWVGPAQDALERLQAVQVPPDCDGWQAVWDLFSEDESAYPPLCADCGEELQSSPDDQPDDVLLCELCGEVE